MPTLTDEICKAFPNLKEMYTEKLSMEPIAPKALHECKKLTYISFLTNKLRKLDQKLFEGNAELTYISIQNNLLENIDGKH